jgi:L-lactate utilization protein LutC
MADRRDPNQARCLLGVGLDNEDGHTRLTRGEDYVLMGGSEDTHERMQDRVERFRHSLKKMGTDLQRASSEEMTEAAHKSGLADRP